MPAPSSRTRRRWRAPVPSSRPTGSRRSRSAPGKNDAVAGTFGAMLTELVEARVLVARGVDVGPARTCVSGDRQVDGDRRGVRRNPMRARTGQRGGVNGCRGCPLRDVCRTRARAQAAARSDRPRRVAAPRRAARERERRCRRGGRHGAGRERLTRTACGHHRGVAERVLEPPTPKPWSTLRSARNLLTAPPEVPCVTSSSEPSGFPRRSLTSEPGSYCEGSGSPPDSSRSRRVAAA